MFDAIGYSQKLEEAGFSKKQAEESVKLQMDIINENFASKTDLKEVRIVLQNEIKDLRTELKGDIKELKTELKGDIKELRTELKGDIKELRTEIKEVETRLQNEMDRRFLIVDHRFETLETKLLYKLGALMILIQGAFVTLAKFI